MKNSFFGNGLRVPIREFIPQPLSHTMNYNSLINKGEGPEGGGSRGGKKEKKRGRKGKERKKLYEDFFTFSLIFFFISINRGLNFLI